MAELADGVYADFTSKCQTCRQPMWTVDGKQQPHACLPAETFEAARAAVLDEMGWPDDRYTGAHPDYAGSCWDQAAGLVQRVADAVLAGAVTHVVEVRDSGWTLQHPWACRPNLHDCPVNRAATVADLAKVFHVRGPGRYDCHLDETGDLVVDEAVTDA